MLKPDEHCEKEDMVMTDQQAKKLCLSLMRADTEDEVVQLLKNVGYWDDSSVWHYYGDYENNFNTIGNQQARPDAALVEKLINAVDARLMNEALVRGIDLEGDNAPQSIRAAVSAFFEESSKPNSRVAGRIREWSNSQRTEVARGITLCATGGKPPKNPSFTIADCGEGQTPQMMPDTLLSLNKSNKLRIPFVQGKFNMGGTGVLKFCGRHNLQFVLSRRNPQILNGNTTHPTDAHWGFTVVRREDPYGNRRSSVYTFLAPKTREELGQVLSFSSDSMPIFPDGKDAYKKEWQWGTLIKLYEYSLPNRSHILMKDGLMGRVDLLLPEIALPIRFHECRDYRGHSGSAETTLTGLTVRLEDDKAQNLEDDFPSSCSLRASGQEMTATIYAFKKGKAETYRKNEGIIFVLNGQTHGHLTQDFFRRKNVGLSYLADSLLVVIDCSKFDGRSREDLFMNSRDRLSGGPLRDAIEGELEKLLKDHTGLRALKERRRREEVESKLDDSKPLEDILQSLLKQSPTLSDLFLKGTRISTPFKTMQAQSSEQQFTGKRFPSYFKFKGKDYGHTLQRECHINMRCRIIFETDAENEYLRRQIEPGEFSLFWISGNAKTPPDNYSIHLQNGIASLNLQLPDDCRTGDQQKFLAIATDPSRIDPFENRFALEVMGPAAKNGELGTRRKPAADKNGDEREIPSGIALPQVTEVHEPEWDSKRPPFDKYTALRIINAGSAGDKDDGAEDHDVYDFFINMDNQYLKHEVKTGKHQPDIARARFKYGMVLIGLALLREEIDSKKKADTSHDDRNDDRESNGNIEDMVDQFTKAIAPVLLPIIDSLGSLDVEDESPIQGSGEAT
ncbi:MAG: hypothetical protein ACOYU4_01100 [Thermodesulfobacteriota bacterium]